MGFFNNFLIQEPQPVTTTIAPIDITTTPVSKELEISISPSEDVIRVRLGEPLQISCVARGPYSSLNTLIYKDQTPVEQSDSGNVEVRIESASRKDAGEYLCYGFPPDRSSYAVKRVEVLVGN